MAGGAVHSGSSAALELRNSTFELELQQQVVQLSLLSVGQSGTAEIIPSQSVQLNCKELAS